MMGWTELPTMRRLPRTALVLVAFLAGFSAPVRALDPVTPLAEYGHDVWQDGLPQNSIHAITQTKDGYLWLGTYEGLVRFNGVSFTVFDRRTTPALKTSSVWSLLEDTKGRFWMGTAGAGLVLRENGTFRAFDQASGFPGRTVYSLWEDADGTILAGTENGLARLSASGVLPFPEAESLTGKTVRAVRRDRNGTLWVATAAHGLFRIGASGTSILNRAAGFPSDSVYALAEDLSGAMWIGTYGGGLVRLENGQIKTFTTRDGLPIDLVYSLLVDRHGVLWIGTDTGGLVRYAGGVLESYNPLEGISQALIRSIHEDREGSLWIGTNGGLDRLKDQKVVTYTRRNGLSFQSVRSVSEAPDGTVWLAGDGGVNGIREGRVVSLPGSEEIPNRYFRAVLAARDGTVWLSTNGAGLARVREGKATLLTTGDGLGSNVLNSLYESRDGTLWIGTYGGGLCRLRNGTLSRFGTDEGLIGLNVRVIAEDARGTLWAGTDSGAFKLENGRFRTGFERGGLAGDTVFEIHPDPDGSLWFGTSGGLQWYSEGRIHRPLTADHGLVADKVFRILSDGVAGYWMSSNRGIFHVKRSDLLAAATGKVQIVPTEAFGRSEGMASTQCNGATQPTGWRSRDGRFWFPTLNGATAVDPRRIRKNLLPPPIVIDSARADGRLVSLEDGASLPAGTTHLEFQYDGLSLLTPERVQFRYRLKGFDERWMESGNRRTAYYTGLHAGAYTFQVMAANLDGIWSPEPASVAFQIQATWHERRSVRLGGLLAAAGVLAVVAALRVRRLRTRRAELEEIVRNRTASLAEALDDAERHREEAEKARAAAQQADRAKSAFLSSTSHELRTPLSAILGYSEMLQEDAREMGRADWVSDLDKIQAASHHLLNLINSILDLSKLEAGKMELHLEEYEIAPLLEEVRSIVLPIVEKHGNHFHIENDCPPGLVLGDLIKTKQILLNLVSNAARFTEKGTIRLAAREEAGKPVPDLVFQVTDSGAGMTADQLAQLFQAFTQTGDEKARKAGGTGLGLVISKGFCELMGGSIGVESEPGQGSVFTVRIPSRIERRKKRDPF